MKTSSAAIHQRIRRAAMVVAAIAAGTSGVVCADPVDTTFTLQGELLHLGTPITGIVDLELRLFDALTGGSQIGSTLVLSDLAIEAGLLTVDVDFGSSAFDGDKRWVEFKVDGTTLTPRQPVMPTPYALYALSGPGAEWTLSSTGDACYSGGNVGIGDCSPSARLDLEQVGAFLGQPPLVAQTMLRLDRQVNLFDPSSGPYIVCGEDALLTTAAFTVQHNGNVSIGTRSPAVRLHIHGKSDSTSLVRLSRTGETQQWSVGMQSSLGIPGSFYIKRANSTTPVDFTITPNGYVGLGTADPARKLDVEGTVRTKVLEITGADLAEEFPFSGPVQPGMVVEIDPENPGQLRIAGSAYSRRVAGIVAGANEFSTGVVLGQGTGNQFGAPVALSGRVYVYVDATQRPIQVGDMLTTSDRPGYAMAASDLSRMHGAVIGKAMSELEEGTGLVLVLVNLQ